MIRACLTAALAVAALAGSTQAQVLFNNNGTGSVPGVRTGVGTGSGGADVSLTGAGGTIGNQGGNAIAVPTGGVNALADDFTVPCGFTWNVTTVHTYAYRTGFNPGTFPAELSGYYFRLYKGVPGGVGTTVLFGDGTTNQLANLTISWTGIYRVTAVPGDANRPIMDLSLPVAVSGLTQGTYGVAWSIAAKTGTPFCPIATPEVTGNALRNTTVFYAATPAWTASTVGSGANAEYPFIVEGTSTGAICPPTVAGEVTLVDDAWASFSGPIAAGQTAYVKIVVTDVDAALNTALDFDTVGSLDGSSAVLNTNIALYRGETFGANTGTRVATDNDSGPGTLSLMSFGKGLRGYETVASVGAGNNYNGQTAATLAAGTYYMAITTSATSNFGAAGYTVTTTGGTAGTYILRARKVTNQATITAPVQTVINAGTLTDISLGGTPSLVSTDINSGEVKWVKFTLPGTVARASGHLAIETEGSTLSPANSTALALFAADGSRACQPGAPSGRQGGTDNLSHLTYGLFNGSMAKPSNATSEGFFYNGRSYPAAPNGSDLVAGDYYVAIIPGQASGAFGQNNFDTTPRNAPNSATAGNLKVRIHYYSNPAPAVAPTPVETLTLVDGVTVSSTLVPVKKGGITWFKFNLPEFMLPPGSNTAALDITLDGSSVNYPNFTTNAVAAGAPRASLVLYDATGISTLTNPAMNDDFNGVGVYGQLSYGSGVRSYAKGSTRASGYSTGTGVLLAGDYYLAVFPIDGVAGNSFRQANWDLSSGANVVTATSNVKVNITYYSSTNATPVVTPPNFDRDLGLINVGGSPYALNLTPDYDNSVRDQRWFKFEIDTALTTAGTLYLDIDGFTPANVNEALALFDNSGNLVKKGLAGDASITPTPTGSAMYFGTTSPTGRTLHAAAGVTTEGFASSTDLPAGTYWLCFTRWDNAAPTTFILGSNWTVTGNDAVVNGTTSVNIRTNIPAPAPVGCSPADIAYGDGEPLPPIGAPGGFNPVGPDGGDFDCFFNFYFAPAPDNAVCDIAYGDGEPLPPYGLPGGFNPGVDGGDFDCFFNYYFNGCL